MKRRQELLRSCWQVSLSNEKWDRSEGIFCPFSAPRFCKWLRGRDLNPRPLGYEYNFLVARSFVFLAFVAFRCTVLASVISPFPTQFPTSVHVTECKSGLCIRSVSVFHQPTQTISAEFILPSWNPRRRRLTDAHLASLLTGLTEKSHPDFV